MDAPFLKRPRFYRGLSARLLALTVAFVMIAEILILVPSVARFRMEQIEEYIEKANLAVLALEATPDHMVSHDLEMSLLKHAGAYTVVLRKPDRRVLMLNAPTPPTVDVSFDVKKGNFFDWIADAFSTLVQTHNRVMLLTGPSRSSKNSTDVIEVVTDETPLRDAMYAFAGRTLSLSLLISLVGATLLYFSLQWLMVRPILRIAHSMIRFRENPEDERTTIAVSLRSDEIGFAQREIAAMQIELRGALRQKTRLATLGAAVARLHHDLRNALATAVLASDGLAEIDEPRVQRFIPRLVDAIDRATALTSRTLDFAKQERPIMAFAPFLLAALVDDVIKDVEASVPRDHAPFVIERKCCDFTIEADRSQLYRVFKNLIHNALQSGAGRVVVDGQSYEHRVVIDVVDDGPGIPSQIRERLFQPFVTFGHHGGCGLGLVIIREIVDAHSGRISVAATSSHGTTFRVELPDASARS